VHSIYISLSEYVLICCASTHTSSSWITCITFPVHHLHVTNLNDKF